MHDINQFVSRALATSKLKGQDWLTDLAVLAYNHRKTLEYDNTNPNTSPQVIIRNMGDNRWLAFADDGNLEPEDVRNTIVNFDAQYAAMLPEIEQPFGPDYNYDDDEGDEGDEGDDEFVESLPYKIVDVLLEAEEDAFLTDFSREQEREGGTPLNPVPTGKNIVRAVELPLGYRLYIWKSDKRREYYGMGPSSFYLGYRIVKPGGTIVFEGSDFHPGSVGEREFLSDSTIASLLIGLLLDPRENDEEFFGGMSPYQVEFLKSEDADTLRQAAFDAEDGRLIDWKDLPGYEYQSEAK